jgi:hypothetical protein
MKLQDLPHEVQRYFVESYKYYVSFEPNDMTDEMYDVLCQRIWKKLQDGEYPYEVAVLLDADLLSAGSGYSISFATYQELGIME